jgi:hypothetical protein
MIRNWLIDLANLSTVYTKDAFNLMTIYMMQISIRFLTEHRLVKCHGNILSVAYSHVQSCRNWLPYMKLAVDSELQMDCAP